jgi:Leucine-rich repeat (LRR) protein
MKSFLIFILFFIGMATPLAAQNDCYKNLRREGLSLLKKKSYRQAVDKFFAARYCPNKPEKDDLDELIKQTQDQWVAALDQAQQKTALALAKADSALTLANKIIDAFYFYKDSFALAFKDDKYGFINKKGEVVIPYEYEEALPFDNSGHAWVKRWDGAYLLDTKGVEYRLATELNKLDSNVVALDLRDQELDTFPEMILENPQLKILLLSKNHLTTLPEGLRKLTNLQSLNLATNQLDSLPLFIGELHQLQTLELSFNRLRNLPVSIGKLDQLKALDLRGNYLSSLPETIGELQQLRVLNLHSNSIENFPSVINKLTNLQSLNLHRNGLRNLPASISQLRNLRHLDISFNGLRELPESIGLLVYLQTLELAENSITKLPESIGQLRSLPTLNLYGSDLEGLPASIIQLKNLRELNLSANAIKELPEKIGQLSNLQVLSLSQNKLTRLPVSVGQLSRLQNLDVSYNLLEDLPVSIGQLRNLQTINLEYNKLELQALQKLPLRAYIQQLLHYAGSLTYSGNYTAALNYYQALAVEKPNTDIKREAAIRCSNLTWQLLFQKKFRQSLQAALLALQFDAINANLYTNLPLAYLFNNQFEKAKAIYLAYKNKMYNEEQSYKMVFLNDFDDLESKGITHPDIAKIRLFLEK